MPSWAASPGVRRSMQSNRPRDTRPERALRSALHRAGLRFRKHVRPEPGLACEADVVFPSAKLAIFIDGCFWHGCPTHGSRPRLNSDFWTRKLDRNRERDRANDEALVAAGWNVHRIWEHVRVDDAVTEVQDRLARLGAGSPLKRRKTEVVANTH
jgi:DNA mismatch endonuclease (patch repair protein)